MYYDEMKHAKNYEFEKYYNHNSVTYINTLPTELVEELLLYFSYSDLLSLRPPSLLNRYITNKFWIKRLAAKTNLPIYIFRDMIDKLNEMKAYKFIYLLNITVRDYMCRSKSDKETLAIYEDICILFLDGNLRQLLIISKHTTF